MTLQKIGHTCERLEDKIACIIYKCYEQIWRCHTLLSSDAALFIFFNWFFQ